MRTGAYPNCHVQRSNSEKARSFFNCVVGFCTIYCFMCSVFFLSALCKGCIFMLFTTWLYAAPMLKEVTKEYRPCIVTTYQQMILHIHKNFLPLCYLLLSLTCRVLHRIKVAEKLALFALLFNRSFSAAQANIRNL